jgi:hypothetical protein
LKRFLVRLFATCALAALIGAISTMPAAAHESRKVGPYEFVVGWGDEPNFTGFKNSVQLILSDAKTGKPVNELGGTVNVEVVFGDASTTLEMEPAFLPGVFGEEGDYRAYIVPTRAGEYAFTFSGSIQGTEIDEIFTCGEETFDCAADAGEIEFPVRDPSRGELAGRLEQELPRVKEASDDASASQTLGWVGAGLGALALLVALGALVRGRRTP